ncbi:hypothetical protein GALL_516200 [mine drainage metagenome]|uniref:Uncharacterized protein n=1 Tax=mine drainage metagenome TaxID=410659 RepID=A0A1J5P5J4_9ZZZZ
MGMLHFDGRWRCAIGHVSVNAMRKSPRPGRGSSWVRSLPMPDLNVLFQAPGQVLTFLTSHGLGRGHHGPLLGSITLRGPTDYFKGHSYGALLGAKFGEGYTLTGASITGAFGNI